jgi:hypothetical protein
MPRKQTYCEFDVVHHLISRFVDREYFIRTHFLRHLYLELQAKALRRVDWQLLAYAIMSNHIHLIAIAGMMPLHRWLRPVHSPFAEAVNEVRRGRIGAVFVRGPKAYPISDHRLRYLLAYVHNNPVRAKVCGSAIESDWTSHRAYLGEAEAPPWLNVSLGLELAGLSREDFNEWVNDPVMRADTSFSEAAHEEELRLVRRADQGILLPDDELAHAIVDTVSLTIGTTSARISSGSRGPSEQLARHVAVQCSEMLGLADTRIARALNLSQQRVSVLRRKPTSNEVRAIAAMAYDDLRQRCAS